MGKSRLTVELTNSHYLDGWLVLHASSLSYGQATSYLPVIQLLKHHFRIGDHATQEEIRGKLTGTILALDRGLDDTLPALLALLDANSDDVQWKALDPTPRRRLMQDAARRLLLREAQVRPLLVIFEDLHWIDSESQAFLDNLVETLPTAKLLLLINYRPEYQHRWGNRTFYTPIRLDPLAAESVGELLRGLLGLDATVRPLEQMLITRTDGNPFFLEESVRALVESGALVGKRGDYRLVAAPSDVHVPATVQAILAARIHGATWIHRHAFCLEADHRS